MSETAKPKDSVEKVTKDNNASTETEIGAAKDSDTVKPVSEEPNASTKKDSSADGEASEVKSNDTKDSGSDEVKANGVNADVDANKNGNATNDVKIVVEKKEKEEENANENENEKEKEKNDDEDEDEDEVKEEEEEVEMEMEKKEEDDTDSDDAEPSKLESSIIRQVEYYFGDSNLYRDKFMKSQIALNDGWVPLTLLLTFKRLAALSTDENVIVEAMAKSKNNLVEISEDHKSLRRHPEQPLPELSEEARQELISRSVYVKGFPRDSDMSTLIEFFEKFDKVVAINMRKYLHFRTKQYKFKGSVFATFETREKAKAFLNTPSVKFNNVELIRKWRDAYHKEKAKEIKKRTEKVNKLIEKWKNLPPLPVKTVLSFECPAHEGDVTREMVNDAVKAVKRDCGSWTVAFMDYSKNRNNGYIRFEFENDAPEFLKNLVDKKLKLLNVDIELTIKDLTEEEEKEYLQKTQEKIVKARTHHIQTKQQKRKYPDGGHKGNKGHDAKKKRTEEPIKPVATNEA